MRIGITGANGFIGSHLLRSAVERGLRPRALVQKGTSLLPISDLDGAYDRVDGDLLDTASLDRFVEGCDQIFHLAGFNRYWSTDPAIFRKINIDGVRNMAETCLKHGTPRLVHASSCITLGASDTPTLRNEDSDYNLRSVPFAYGETKKAGEIEMQRYARERKLPVVIVNPTSAVGEKDYGPTPIGKPIGDIARGMWPVYVAGGACFIDIHDCVRGFWAAMEKGRIGEKYLLVGDNLTNQEFMSTVAELAGVKPPRIKIPKPVLGVVARASEFIADHFTHEHPPITRGMNGMVGRFLFFDRSKSERELGFTAGPSRAAIGRCIEWFRTN